MPRINPYEILGIAKDADEAAIKKAFRDRSKETHPDAGGDQQSFALVKLSKDVLMDAARRRKFDNTGEVDEDTVDRTEAAAWGLIAHMLGMALSGEEDPLKNPLIEPMVDFCRKTISDNEETRAKFGIAITRAEKMLARFTKKKKKKKKDEPESAEDTRNVMQIILTGRIGEFKEFSRRCDEQIAIAKRALEIVQEYQYDFDKAQQVVFQNCTSSQTKTYTFSGG